MRTGRSLSPLLASLLVLPAGCETFGLGEDEKFSVSFAVAGQQRLGLPSFAVLTDSIVFGGHTLDLQTVDITLDEITVERAELSSGGDSDGDSDVDSDSDGASNERLRRRGTVIALPMQGGIITPIDEALPHGYYEELELDFQSIRLSAHMTVKRSTSAFQCAPSWISCSIRRSRSMPTRIV